MADAPPRLRVLDLRPGVLDAAGRRFPGRVRWSLTVDRQSGWVHWQRRGAGAHETESFSPDRLRGVRVQQIHGTFPWSNTWCTILGMDHPRIPEVILATSRNKNAALQTAQLIAESLEIKLI